MSTRFDHLVIAVDDLDAAIERWTAAGLPAVRGGRHPGGTENALIRGPAAAYVELIAAAPEASGPWADRVRDHAGPLSWAIAVDDLAATRAAVVAAGFDPGEIADGSRVTPDGDTIRWRMLQVGREPFDSELPFLIQWDRPMPPGPADGPVVTSVSVTADDDAPLRRLLVAVGLIQDSDVENSFGDAPDHDNPVHQGPVGVWISRSDCHVELPPEREGRVFSSVLVEGPSADVELGFDVVAPGRRNDMARRELDGLVVSQAAGVRAAPGAALLEYVEERFAARDPELRRWPDPHLGQAEDDEAEYSRVTDEPRYRIVAARARAWLDVLADQGLATLSDHEPDAIEWELTSRADGPPRATHVTVAEPVADGAARLVVSWGADFPFVHLAAGGPAVPLELIPDCGCDHCDSGSDDLLVQVDETILHVLGGDLVYLRRGDRTASTGFYGEGASGLGADRLMADLPRVAAGEDVGADHVLVGGSWLT